MSATLADREPWPDPEAHRNRLLVETATDLIRPGVFTTARFPFCGCRRSSARTRRATCGKTSGRSTSSRAYAERFPTCRRRSWSQVWSTSTSGRQAQRHAHVMDQALGRPPSMTSRRAPETDACVLPVPACTDRSATSWSYAACVAVSTSRRCTSTSAAASSSSRQPGRARGCARRATRGRSDAGPGVLDADRRAGGTRRACCQRRARQYVDRGNSQASTFKSQDRSLSLES